MLEELIAGVLPPIISICELMGIFVVAVSALRAFWNYCKGLVTHVPLDVKFDLANGLATSLEFAQEMGMAVQSAAGDYYMAGISSRNIQKNSKR